MHREQQYTSDMNANNGYNPAPAFPGRKGPGRCWSWTCARWSIPSFTGTVLAGSGRTFPRTTPTTTASTITTASGGMTEPGGGSTRPWTSLKGNASAGRPNPALSSSTARVSRPPRPVACEVMTRQAHIHRVHPGHLLEVGVHAPTTRTGTGPVVADGWEERSQIKHQAIGRLEPIKAGWCAGWINWTPCWRWCRSLPGNRASRSCPGGGWWNAPWAG